MSVTNLNESLTFYKTLGFKIEYERPENKFVFICNMYLEDKENYLIKGDLLNKCNIVEYINYVNEENLDINVLSKNTNFNKIAYVVS